VPLPPTKKYIPAVEARKLLKGLGYGLNKPNSDGLLVIYW